jgi:hypothetical protein
VHLQIVNIKQIWHEDGISYGKMLRHVEVSRKE